MLACKVWACTVQAYMACRLYRLAFACRNCTQTWMCWRRLVSTRPLDQSELGALEPVASLEPSPGPKARTAYEGLVRGVERNLLELDSSVAARVVDWEKAQRAWNPAVMM